GFPTANLAINKSTPSGIFVSITKIKNDTYNSITFIGTADTFDETDFVAETYILNFDQDIYGEEVEINILQKLRDNQKFESVEMLTEQMKIDKEEAEKFFREHIR
ncbi:MAG TPA: riboflavin kinase, partial [Candidatus Saccharimonadales bacterium]|nr:riboflavin kinase [Candidatus Saccharimonadales bacterium]